ncbi:MAG: hypothetical protein OEY94_01125 [Alphaproteobacteria bacterium]|nr:hypothetical protein [Alphaproteobacteria bacterium]
MTSKTPQETLRDANLKASIWRNESEQGSYFTTTLARTYKDEQGNYRDTNSFGQNDLLRLAELSRSAYNRVNEIKREEFRDKRQAPSRGRNSHERNR